MKMTYYNRVDETLYHDTLDNGLDVYIIVKRGYKEKCAYFGTKFGSLQTGDILVDEHGNKHPVLGGIAHFLEHRLFDNKRGNVMDLYDNMGASCNAFTSFNKTVYYFSSINNFDEGLNLLLDYPSEFEMSEEAVEGEKDIIIQEVKMYKDMPDRVLFFEGLRSLYNEHPITSEIGGEIEEVSATTRQLLGLCHSTFYDPSNMTLVVVGDVDVRETLELIKKNQAGKNFKASEHIVKEINESIEVAREFHEIKMNSNIDKVFIGYKMEPLDNLDTFSQNKVVSSLDIIGNILFSKSGEYYEDLVKEGLISNIESETLALPKMNAFFVSAESTKVDELAFRIKEIVASSLDTLTEERLQSNKKAMLSSLLYDCNSCSKLGYNFVNNILEDFNYFEMEEVIRTINLEYLKMVCKHYLLNAKVSVTVMKNKDD